jgi:hypothetical protein
MKSWLFQELRLKECVISWAMVVLLLLLYSGREQTIGGEVFRPFVLGFAWLVAGEEELPVYRQRCRLVQPIGN